MAYSSRTTAHGDLIRRSFAFQPTSIRNADLIFEGNYPLLFGECGWPQSDHPLYSGKTAFGECPTETLPPLLYMAFTLCVLLILE